VAQSCWPLGNKHNSEGWNYTKHGSDEHSFCKSWKQSESSSRTCVHWDIFVITPENRRVTAENKASYLQTDHHGEDESEWGEYWKGWMTAMTHLELTPHKSRRNCAVNSTAKSCPVETKTFQPVAEKFCVSGHTIQDITFFLHTCLARRRFLTSPSRLFHRSTQSQCLALPGDFSCYCQHVPNGLLRITPSRAAS
jgi:hypothetical protein